MIWLPGISSAVLVGSLYFVWFTAPGSPSDGFFLGVESAFQANGYPDRVAVRLIVALTVVIEASIALRWVIELTSWKSRPADDRRLGRLLIGATLINLALAIVAMCFPPHPMVRFASPASCPAAYWGLTAATIALVSSLLVRRST